MSQGESCHVPENHCRGVRSAKLEPRQCMCVHEHLLTARSPLTSWLLPARAARRHNLDAEVIDAKSRHLWYFPLRLYMNYPLDPRLGTSDFIDHLDFEETLSQVNGVVICPDSGITILNNLSRFRVPHMYDIASSWCMWSGGFFKKLLPVL